MNILSGSQYRVLAFVAACNRSSYSPTVDEVMVWHDCPEPREAEYRLVGRGGVFDEINSLSRMVETMSRRFSPWLSGNLGSRELVNRAESITAHLVRLGWLAESRAGDGTGLKLTELGRALLRDRELETTAEDVSVVVLESNDPLAYPLLVGQLANAGAGLLVDPYLKLDGLNRIIVSTQLTRLLVSGKRNNNGELSAIETHLASASLARGVEVRKSTKLHDRILLADDGTIFTLGTSLNGVGNTTTVLSPMPSPAKEVLRDEYERLWAEAEHVGPQPAGLPSEGETESDGPPAVDDGDSGTGEADAQSGDADAAS